MCFLKQAIKHTTIYGWFYDGQILKQQNIPKP